MVEKNEPLDPIHVRFFGADRVMFSSDRLADLVEQPGGWIIWHRCRLINDRYKIPMTRLNAL